MKFNNKYFKYTVLSILVFGFVYFFPNQIAYTFSNVKEKSTNLASVVLGHNFRTVAKIKSNYGSAKKVRILLVPGHEPNQGGTTYKTLAERDMTVELSQELQKLLENNPHYQVFVTRDKEEWSPEFAKYFESNLKKIIAWKNASKKEFSKLVEVGKKTKPVSTVPHNSAPQDVALRLFGVTKWSNDNNIDIVLHIHFNDFPRKNVNEPGEYSGFSIYIPASQYGNSTTTRAVATKIFDRLAKYNSVSTLPQESGGIIDEPKLIAVGVNNTSNAASLLIEYGYIYEEKFQNEQTRSLAIKNLASDTYLGIQDFFGEK